MNRQSGQVDIENIVDGIVSQALIKRPIQQPMAQLHRFLPEKPRIHEFGRVPDDGPERHSPEDIGLEVDSRGHFDQFQTLLTQPEHATLRHIQDLLSPRRGVDSAEGAMLDALDKLPGLAFGDDP